MYEHFWTELLLFLQITRQTYTTPYDWDSRKAKFMIIRTPKYVKIFKVLSHFNFFHMGIMLWNLLQILQNERNVVPKIVSLIVAAFAAFMEVCRWMHTKRAEDIVSFLNCMVESARSATERGKFAIDRCVVETCIRSLEVLIHWVSGTANFTTLIVKFLMRIFCVPLFILLIVFPVLPLLSPRIPPFVGYFLCRSSRDWLGVDTCRLDDDGMFNIPRGNVVFNLFRIVGCLISLAFTSSILNAPLVSLYEVFPSIVFQNDRLGQLRVAARNPRTFSNPVQIIRKYRELQILNIMFNKIYQREYFVFCMGIITLVVIANGYFAITMHNFSGIFVMLGIYMTFMEYIILIILFRMASKVWSNSVEFAWSWKRNDRASRMRLMRRYGKSLQPLKVKIGSTNFVELNTPFVFFSFCMEQTISLVLLNQ
jgi:hypothetical protein